MLEGTPQRGDPVMRTSPNGEVEPYTTVAALTGAAALVPESTHFLVRTEDGTYVTVIWMAAAAAWRVIE